MSNISEEMLKATPIFAALTADINRAAKGVTESLQKFAESIKPFQEERSKADKTFRANYSNIMKEEYNG